MTNRADAEAGTGSVGYPTATVRRAELRGPRSPIPSSRFRNSASSSNNDTRPCRQDRVSV